MTANHLTPRMGNRPDDPAYVLLTDQLMSTPKVRRDGCYICTDVEYARTGLPLCFPCCICRAYGTDGHIAADADACDDCDHERCLGCIALPAQAREICTCGSRHCPIHGFDKAGEGMPGWQAS